jgi:uncharacterized protein YlaI
MQFDCPVCEFDGEFDDGKLPFFVFSLLDTERERNKSERTYTCPECKTQIVLSIAAKKQKEKQDKE